MRPQKEAARYNNMPKKVLFVITKSVWGGAQRYVYDLATALPKESYAAVVALGGEGPLKEKLQKAGVPTISIPSLERDINVFKELRSVFSLWHIINREKPDVVHLNSSKVGGIGAIAAIASKLWTKNDKLKTVFTVHGWAFNESRKFFQKSAIYLLQWVTAALSDHIVVISRHDYRQAIQMPLIRNEKFLLIPLGIPAERVEFLAPQKARSILSKLFSVPRDTALLGTIAELTPNKGLVHLVDSVAKLKDRFPDYRCLIIGGGEQNEFLAAHIASLGLGEQITLAGFVPDAARYIKGFDAFILPSLKEGLPYTILEAMHAGVPVIASSVGGIPDLIEHEKTGLLVPTKNAAELASAQEKILGNKTIRAAYGKRSKKRAQEKFPFSAMLEKTLTLYA